MRVFKQIAGFILFFAILGQVFSSTTYLFRRANDGRSRMVGIKNESKLDVVYIGGSSTFDFWQPLRAWNDCGFTSYCLAENAIKPECYKPLAELAEKYNDPQLYVICAYPFNFYSTAEQWIRGFTDSMDLTEKARYDLLNQHYRIRDVDDDTDILSYYIDILEYHENRDNLALEKAWEFLHNEGSSETKGFAWEPYYKYIDPPQRIITDDREDLPEGNLEVLRDFTEYLKMTGKEALFVAIPNVPSNGYRAQYNTIMDAVEEAGFTFLDLNDYYDEIGIDFTNDYYNDSHVNPIGAKKYTQFLENYIVDNYELPDHRDDPLYEDWNRKTEEFYTQEKKIIDTVEKLQDDYRFDNAIAEEIGRTENLAEWYEYVTKDRFTFLIAVNTVRQNPLQMTDRNVFDKIGLEQSIKDTIIIVSGGETVYRDSGRDLEYIEPNESLYSVSLKDGFIYAYGEEIPIDNMAVNVVVLDDERQIIVDKARLECDDNSRIVFNRGIEGY